MHELVAKAGSRRGRPFKRSGHVLKYLGRYTHRVGIANSRLVEVPDETVTFRTKNGRTVTVTPVEFLRRFVQHVLPDGFREIRHYGLYAGAAAEARASREVDDVPVGCTETHLVWGDELEAGIRVATIDDPATSRWLELPERVRHVTTGHGQVGLVLRRGLARLDDDLRGARLLHPDASFGRLVIARDAWFVERGGQLAYSDAGEEKTGPAILAIDPGGVLPPRTVWTAAPDDGPRLFGVLRSQPRKHWTVSAAGLAIVTATQSGFVVAQVRC